MKGEGERVKWEREERRKLPYAHHSHILGVTPCMLVWGLLNRMKLSSNPQQLCHPILKVILNAPISCDFVKAFTHSRKRFRFNCQSSRTTKIEPSLCRNEDFCFLFSKLLKRPCYFLVKFQF